jgi:acetyltransferase
VITQAMRPVLPARSAHPPNARVKKLLATFSDGALDEIDSKKLLRTNGISCPKETVAKSECEAVAAAQKIGFPVVAKAVSSALAHKSDAGAVKLNLASAREVREAYKTITAVAKRAHAPLDGVLIAQQVSDGIELVLGMHRDPEMGPVLLFGAGGVELELHRDVAFAAPPLDEASAAALIARTRVAKRIAGYRGKRALDRKALIKALLALSQFTLDAGERLESVDINPFLLKGRGGVALDALVVLTDNPARNA